MKQKKVPLYVMIPPDSQKLLKGLAENWRCSEGQAVDILIQREAGSPSKPLPMTTPPRAFKADQRWAAHPTADLAGQRQSRAPITKPSGAIS